MTKIQIQIINKLDREIKQCVDNADKEAMLEVVEMRNAYIDSLDKGIEFAKNMYAVTGVKNDRI